MKVIGKGITYELSENQVKLDIVGHKACGLHGLPPNWTLPYILLEKSISLKFFSFTEESQRVNFLNEIAESVLKACETDSLGCELIIRSSAISEDLNERGRYESISCNKKEFARALSDLLMKMSLHENIKENGIPLVIQKYLPHSYRGHLSNERKFSKDLRDFVFELYLQDSIFQKNISYRAWRKKYDLENLLLDNLNCRNKEEIENVLRKISAYFYLQKKRVHVEFVFLDNRIYIVQVDSDIKSESTFDPSEFDIKITNARDKMKFHILKNFEECDTSNYYKINNVKVYQKLDLAISPLYIIDDRKIIEEFREGILQTELCQELSLLLQNSSIVIRTNVISEDLHKRQLSRRSNELKNIEDVSEFLFDCSKDFVDYQFAFILHNYIPAISSAFINAKPNHRIVEIQSLWGVPEGLYYYSHDRITVDLLTKDMNKVQEDRIKPIVRCSYKPCFISSDESGKWIKYHTKAPKDWDCSIQSTDSMIRMAILSQKISNIVGKELSIMWFIGIDSKFYGSNEMPWHHEEIKSNSYTNNYFMKKNFDDEEIVISNYDDLKKLQNNKCNGNEGRIKYIKIQPYEDECFRDKDFITKIGELAKEINGVIFLEGAILAHSFYQLTRTEANVVVAKKFKEYSEEQDFNKLVRDHIPRNILNNGESVEYFRVQGTVFLLSLLNKLLEEAYEIFDSISLDEFLMEIADLYEVLECILNNYDAFKCELFPCKYKQNLEKFDFKFDEEQKVLIKDNVILKVVREKSSIHIEVRFLENHCELLEESDYIEIAAVYIEVKRKILKLSKFCFFSTDIKQLRCRIKKLKIYIDEFLSQNEYLKLFEKFKDSKNKKNGNFNKGYVLSKTLLSAPVESKEEIKLFDFEEQPPIRESINYDTKKSVDLLFNQYKTLLLRLEAPIYLTEKKFTFKSFKLKEFFEREIYLEVFLLQKDQGWFLSFKAINEVFQHKLDLL